MKLFVALEIQYFELSILSFNSYVYYVTREFNLWFIQLVLLILQIVLLVF